MQSRQVRGIKGSNFEIVLEYGDGLIAIHLPTVDKFNKSTFLEMKYMLEDWNDLFRASGYPMLISTINENDLKTKRLAEMFSFKKIDQFDTTHIYGYMGE